MAPNILSPLRTVSALVATSALLAACATGGTPLVAPDVAPPSAEPAPLNGDYSWFFGQEGDQLQLLYGVANSDDVPLSMACRSRSGQIEVSMASATAAPAIIHLASATQSRAYAAKAEEAGVFDGYILSAKTTPDDPVLQDLVAHGWLAMLDGNRWVGLRGDSELRDHTTRFLAGCKR
ncbi:hypothetical protein [uncultured Brevundimonas sp.]|uniref:hypothetical protein n=1 Tax=uncultured Brevundimonas sp. TaxID=213418 RepID=UPI0026376EF2|nr:hypothetical protein [uncultured Brevundimonas sp.]